MIQDQGVFYKMIELLAKKQRRQMRLLEITVKALVYFEGTRWNVRLYSGFQIKDESFQILRLSLLNFWLNWQMVLKLAMTIH